MAAYECYMFGAGNSPTGAANAIDAAESIQADTDDAALIKMESLFRQRGSLEQGFEIWQSARLVHRHPVSRGRE